MVVRHRDKIRSLEGEIKAILKQEEEEKQLRLSEMEINKARNLVEHEAEILSRPARTWIQGEGQRKRGAGQDASQPLSKKAKEEIKKEKFKKPETVRVFFSAVALFINPCVPARGESCTETETGAGVHGEGSQESS